MDEILDLRAEAAASRRLAETFSHLQTVIDLENYACALEIEALRLETRTAPATLRDQSRIAVTSVI